MHLIFFDEVKSSRDYPYYHIGGICLEEADLAEIEARVQALSMRFFGDSRLRLETEFHAHDIYKGKKNFIGLHDIEDRIALITELASILSDERISLINIRVSSDRFPTHRRTGEVAFMFLCERVNQLMRGRRSLGMLIGDREHDGASERASYSLSDYRAARTEFAYGENITHVFESVHFAASHLSRFLQLADAYAWILQFKKKHRESTRQVHQRMFTSFRQANVDLYETKYKIWPNEAS